MTAQVIRDDYELGLALRDVGSTEQSGVVVVITTRAGERVPAFDAATVAEALGAQGRVLEVPPHLTHALNDRLGDDLAVYGGAARVFPVRAAKGPYAAPIVTLPREGAPRLDILLREARRALAASTGPTAAPAPGPERRPAVPTGTGGVTPIDTPALAAELATHLLSPERTRPVLLVTRRAGDDRPLVDVGRIVDDVGTLVDVFDMATGDVSWAFARALDRFPGTECYGGAGRVYPVGLDWTNHLHRSPLRFVWNEHEARAATDALIRDALASSRLSTYSAAPTAGGTVCGSVVGAISGRALVTLEQGGSASIWPELTAPGLPADRLVTPGMRVTGHLDPDTRRLDVSASLVPASTALADYDEGDLVTARVVAVEQELAILEVFPEVQTAVPADEIVSGRFVVDVREWLSEGEVVAARVVTVGANDDDWELSLLDIDPDTDPLAAPALLPGGPPWLPAPLAWDEPEPEKEAETQAPPPVPVDVPEPTPAPTTPTTPRPPEAPAEPSVPAAALARVKDDLRVMAAERDALAREVARLQGTAQRAAGELSKLKSRAREREQQVAKLSKQVAAKDKELSIVADILEERDRDRNAFTDPEEQFRYEVELEWARRIPADEKNHLSRDDYRLGPDFLPTLAELTDRDRAKAIEVVIEIQTRRVYTMPGRHTHQLRTGAGGDDAYVTRADGSNCWRVYLQHGTPQARRLHFWALPDSSVELSSVRQHDDIRP